MIYFRKMVPVGRSTSVTIPKAICDDLGWNPYDDVAVFVTKDGAVFIRKIPPHEVRAFAESFEPIINVD